MSLADSHRKSPQTQRSFGGGGKRAPEKRRQIMFRRAMLYVAIVAAVPLATCLLLLTPAQARADHDRGERREWHERGHDRRPEHRRLVWQYQGGFFKDTGNGQWMETNATGTYHFREVGRNRDF